MSGWFPDAGTWEAWGTWATAVIASGASLFAYQQVKEARETRERVAQPDVVVYIDHHEVRHYLDLVVKNFGQTTAYNVRMVLPPIQVAPYMNQATGEQVTQLWLPETIAVLAPGQEWRTVWDSAVRRERHRKAGGELQTQFVGRVDFDDKTSAPTAKYSNPVSLDAKMFHNTTWVRQSESKNIKDALYEIAATLKSYKGEHDGIWVYTVPGDEERRRRELELIEDRRAYEELLGDIGAAQQLPNDDDSNASM